MTATTERIFPIAPPELWPPDIDPADPFRLGHRYLTFSGPDGAEVFGVRPLGEEDIIHPQEGDYVVQGDDHDLDRTYMRIVVTRRVEYDPTIRVFSDLGIRWPGEDLIAPDLTVCFGLLDQRPRGTYDVAAEGINPRVVIEIVSPSTASADRGRKKALYALHGVEYYVLYDRTSADKPLEGFVLENGVYRELPLDERGWLWVPPLRMWFARTDGVLTCYDEAGKRLRRYSELDAENEALTEANETLTEANADLSTELQHEAAARAAAEERAAAAEEHAAAVQRENAALAARLAALEAAMRRQNE